MYLGHKFCKCLNEKCQVGIILGFLLLLSVSCWAVPNQGLSQVDSAVKKRQKNLVSALHSLKLHITNAAPLSPLEIAERKSTIDANKDLFGSSRAIITASFKLVETYDTEIGPMWVTGSPVKNFSRAKVSNSDINWVVYTVMQNIIDKTYTARNIAANKYLFASFKFGSSVYFPGAVDPPADPQKTYTARINASFLKSFGRDTMYWIKPARKPTGTYLAPGTVATVTVPQSLVSKGYQIRVGGHSWDFFRLPKLYRLDRCSVLYDINAAKIKVSNPLGGGIYIEVPYLADQGIVDVKIKNAVPSPYYSAKSFHTTTGDEWKNIQRHHKAPWADFQTEKFMINVPTDWIYKLNDPAALVAQWDKSMDATNELMGFPLDRGKETLFAQVDLNLPFGFHATGYPAVNAWYDPDKKYGGSSDHYLITGPKDAAYFEFHEMGHGYLFPKIGSDIESTVNLLHVAVLNRKLGFSLDEAFQKSAPDVAFVKSGPAYNSHRTIDNAAICWMMFPNFKNNKPMDTLEKSYQHKGHAKYVEVARLFGWDVLGNYWKAYMLEGKKKTPIDNGKVDPVILRLSKAANVDIRPLFHFWGVHPKDPASLQKAIAADKLLPSMAIYRTLKKYQSLIPENKAAFQKFALLWWSGKEDAAKSKYAAIWNSYDQAYANLIHSNVQKIIDQYFPDGPPEVVGADDSEAPVPNPMTFLIPPAATGEQSISMTAAKASDSSWVQYYFTNTSGAGHNSGWQGSRTYEDTGLKPNTAYAYTVKTRDYSPAKNTSSPSRPVSARTKVMDNVSPSPARMSMNLAPVATSPSTIYMLAATASDDSQVEYKFTCTAGGGHDSQWQKDPSYTDTGLKPETKYSYTVTARDKSPQHNKTSVSKELSAATKTATTEPYLVMNKPVSAIGEDIVVHYVTPSETRWGWLGIFGKPTTADSSRSDGIQYQYFGGKPDGSTGMKSGTLTFNGLSAGTYQARLHYKSDYPIKARIEFTVK